MPTLEKLKNHLENLKLKRYEIECSDDFAYTNGKIRDINSEIFATKQQIEELEKENAKS